MHTKKELQKEVKAVKQGLNLEEAHKTTSESLEKEATRKKERKKVAQMKAEAKLERLVSKKNRNNLA